MKIIISKYALLAFCFLFSLTTANAQEANSMAETEILNWLEDLYEHGTQVVEDSVLLNEETIRILNDEDYRAMLYPEIYTWQTTMEFMERQELKKAFWFMLNLYMTSDKNKDLVVKSILTYDALFDMNQVMEATYKTYGILDPAIGEIVDGVSHVTAPHILEQKLLALKEIVAYIDKYGDSSKAE